ncbi:pentatricopeptide repeat-containing protein At3g12770 [Cryptomeria japonica]|uniref:pentatricopeptide repeat-containing protein At3g12770 n=1 Tax=Cryptomeria japonica TaxID=3369 RepID=UPI0027DA7230|nr:pentatricopeptide repeat-containing protein At3g12770 [Cryptomeria japonica]
MKGVLHKKMSVIRCLRTMTVIVFNCNCSRMNHSTHFLRYNHTLPSEEHFHLKAFCREGRLKDARKIFDNMTEKDVLSWNLIIATYRRHGYPQEALKLFQQIQRTGVQPDHFTFTTILPTCAQTRAMEKGMEIHQNIIDRGFLWDVVVVNALMDMYAKCGRMHKARELFDKMPQQVPVSWNTMIAGYAQNGALDEALQILKRMPQPNVISWTAMIAGYAQNGIAEKALEIFYQMQLAGVKQNSTTFVSIIPACAKLGAVKQGKEIHRSTMESGLSSNVVIASALMDMYAKCGSVHKAQKLFDKMPQRDVVSWTSMIAGYTQNGFVEQALETFKQMQLVGVRPNSTTYASILPACAKMGALEPGMGIHQTIIESGFSTDLVVVNALIDMYAKCGSISKAHELFDNMPQRNVVSWAAIIAVYTQNGLVEKSLETFKQMQLSGVKPSSATFASILTACAKMGALEGGMEIHKSIIDSGFLSDVVVANALIDMYGKCGSIPKAWKLFSKMSERSVVSWTAMIAGYAQNGFLEEASRIFQEMPERNVISWTTMIAGYARNGLVEKALETYQEMQLADVKPNLTTFTIILSASARMGALEEGMDIHRSVIESGLCSNAVVVSALIDMYAKCGSIQKARGLFNKMLQRDVVLWTAMIAGYAMHGYGKDALKLFELMKHSGTYPDQVSFVCVLFACSHAGLVDEGCKYFSCMRDFYCITPKLEHYVCVVDILARAGYLEEALIFIIKMPIKPAIVVWMCLLSACRSPMNTRLGAFTANLLFELDPKNAASYVLLSDIYAEVGRWGDAQKVRRLMKDKEIRKTPGCSWIEVHKRVHAFCVGDRSHPQTQEIYAMLEKLSYEMKAAGYAPNSRLALNDVEKEEKELFLNHHSEKLAIAFGLLNTSPGTTVRVVKNLRVCVECHTATKFISKIVARKIVVRDANRFHHFNQGECSCGDYW